MPQLRRTRGSPHATPAGFGPVLTQTSSRAAVAPRGIFPRLHRDGLDIILIRSNHIKSYQVLIYWDGAHSLAAYEPSTRHRSSVLTSAQSVVWSSGRTSLTAYARLVDQDAQSAIQYQLIAASVALGIGGSIIASVLWDLATSRNTISGNARMTTTVSASQRKPEKASVESTSSVSKSSGRQAPDEAKEATSSMDPPPDFAATTKQLQVKDGSTVDAAYRRLPNVPITNTSTNSHRRRRRSRYGAFRQRLRTPSPSFLAISILGRVWVARIGVELGLPACLA
jgi:hypothetical protein